MATPISDFKTKWKWVGSNKGYPYKSKWETLLPLQIRTMLLKLGLSIPSTHSFNRSVRKHKRTWKVNYRYTY